MGSNDFEMITELSIYPNPAKYILNIKGDVTKIREVNIYSITGQHVMEVKSNFKKIDVSSLQAAIYFVKLNTAEASGTVKFIKE